MALPGNKDIKVTASDALEFEPVAAETRKGNFGLKLFVFLVLLGVSAGAWSFFGDGLLQWFGGGDGGVPVIRAQTGPIKVRPENPGGLKVPDRDKLVYDRMQKTAGEDAQDKGRGPERLLPPPEQPLPRPAAKKTAEKPVEKAPAPKPAPTPKTKPVAKVPTVKDVKAAKRPAPPPPPAAPPSSSGQAFNAAPAQTAEKVEAPKKAAPKPASVTAPKPQPVAKAPKPAPVKSVPATLPPSQVSRGGAYLIQLAAARSSQGARTEWERLRTKHRDLLGNLGLTVTKADLGPGKGVFYRLRAGPLVSENTARTLCQQLAQRKVGCLIIKPTR